jgi:hypothetical protein
LPLVRHKDKLEEIGDLLLESISHRTKLTIPELVESDIEEIEKKLKIEARSPRIHFEWEAIEKMGWQLSQNAFVSEEELDRRERKIASLVK